MMRKPRAVSAGPAAAGIRACSELSVPTRRATQPAGFHWSPGEPLFRQIPRVRLSPRVTKDSRRCRDSGRWPVPCPALAAATQLTVNPAAAIAASESECARRKSLAE